MEAYDMARELVRSLMEFHSDALAAGEGTEEFEALVIKCVALPVLAYGIPATEGEPADFEDAMQKLAWANAILMPTEDDVPEEQGHA